MRWLRGHAGDYNIDTTRVMAWGAEAGGQIAAMVGTSCGVATLEPAADANSKASLASDCVARRDRLVWARRSRQLGCRCRARWRSGGAPTHLGAYLGCEAGRLRPRPGARRQPAHLYRRANPPFLIQHGSADTLCAAGPVAESCMTRLKDQRVPAEILIYPGVGQDFAKDGRPMLSPAPSHCRHGRLHRQDVSRRRRQLHPRSTGKSAKIRQSRKIRNHKARK